MALARLLPLRPPQQALRKRLESWSFDPEGSPPTFLQGLAYDNGWSVGHAARVIAEYRRFLFLAAVVDHPVSPSDPVDQAWHRHLLDTRAYWEEFCPQVLGRPLHHSPSRGGAEERQRLLHDYRQTLESYAAIYGEPPPADLWPPPEKRFGRPCPSLGVETRRWWLIRGRWIGAKGLGRPGLLLPLLLVGLGVSGCDGIAGSRALFSLPGPQFLSAYLALTALAMVLAQGVRRWLLREQGGAATDPAELSNYELAYLVGGGARVAQTALLSLLLQEVVQPVASGRPPRVMRGQPLGDPIEEAVTLGLLRHPQGSADAVLRSVGRQAGLMVPLQRRLAELGLVIDARRLWLARCVPCLILGAVLVVGLMRLHQGLLAQRPVGYLLMICLALMGVLVGLWWRRPRHRTARGDRLLRQLGGRYHGQPPIPEPEHLLPAFAVLGLPVVPVSLAMGLVPLLAPVGWDSLRGELARMLTPVFAPGGGGWEGDGGGSWGGTDGGGGGGGGGTGGCGGGCGGCGGGG